MITGIALRAFQLLGEGRVLAFLLGQVTEELPNARVGRPLERSLVESSGFQFHGLDFLAHRLEAERPDQPDWFSVHKAFHVLPAQERDVFAKSLTVQINEPMAMA